MPLSRDERKRRRQLANLRPAPPAPAGNDRAATHRGYAAVAVERLQDRERQVYDALAADAPLRGGDGGLPASDGVVVRLLAEALCRLDDVAADVRAHGWRSRKTGDPRPVLDVEARLRREALDYAEALGMTPRSRARLGLDLARTVDVATAMSEPDAERRRGLLREAGLGEEDGGWVRTGRYGLSGPLVCTSASDGRHSGPVGGGVFEMPAATTVGPSCVGKSFTWGGS